MTAMTSAELEELWVEAWEAVYQIVGTRRDVMCLLPDGAIVNMETCLGWIQDAVYKSPAHASEAG